MNRSQSQHDLDVAGRFLEVALENMRGNNIPTTAENIKVWYYYATGENHRLNREVDEYLLTQGMVTVRQCADLYRKYFVEMDRRKLDMLHKALREMIAQISQHIVGMGDELSGFESALDECAENLQDDHDAEELARAIEHMRQETRKAMACSRKRGARIDQLSREVVELRSSLTELERSLLEDPLTSVANRRAFDQVFASHLLQGQQSVEGCCLLLVDIDHFKQFNDKYGHDVGDKVLRFVATMLKKITKGQDFVARYGGEEFAILLPMTGYKGGMVLANSVCKAIAAARLTIDSDKQLTDSVTVSVGVAWSGQKDSTDTFFRRADKALYQAKHQGRNQAVGQRDIVAA